MHLYIHVPFCARRCSYCDFAIAVRREVPSAAYADALLAEWQTWQAHPAWADSPRIETIYLGGGTPSHLAPEAIERILDCIRADRPVAPDAEITLEANPDDVTAGTAAAWLRAGINRVSLGSQSFDPAVLAWMHRSHTAEQIPHAVRILRDAGVANLSLDLIFALPPALARDWARDFDRALGLEPDHLSLYGLTIEPRTPLARWTTRGESIPADDDAYASEYLHFAARLRAERWDHYEVSNAARPGYRSRHNSAYWRRAPFIGLGPSAHSGFGAIRQWNVREYEQWRARIAAGESTVAGTEDLHSAALELEDRYLGLRTSAGLPANRLPAGQLAQWQSAGWATRSNDVVTLTLEGWLRLDALVASL